MSTRERLTLLAAVLAVTHSMDLFMSDGKVISQNELAAHSERRAAERLRPRSALKTGKRKKLGLYVYYPLFDEVEVEHHAEVKGIGMRFPRTAEQEAEIDAFRAADKTLDSSKERDDQTDWSVGPWNSYPHGGKHAAARQLPVNMQAIDLGHKKAMELNAYLTCLERAAFKAECQRFRQQMRDADAKRAADARPMDDDASDADKIIPQTKDHQKPAAAKTTDDLEFCPPARQ